MQSGRIGVGGAEQGQSNDKDTGFAYSAASLGESCVPDAVPQGGFDADEIYAEWLSEDCDNGGGGCVVYQLQGDPSDNCASDCADPAEITERVFCSCQCDGPIDADNYCECAEGFRCEELFASSADDPAGGSYCIPNGLERQ